MTHPADRPAARLLSVATAAPPHVIVQDEAAARTVALFGGKVFRAQDILSLFANTGIRTRRAVRPMDWYEEARPWEERNAVYLEEAERLWIQAATLALERAGVEPDEVGAVVTVSTTGVATPSLEARAAPKLGLSPNAIRTPVFGLGCAGGVSGLSLAARLAEARPGSAVLLVVVELCTLSVRPQEASKTNVVATALFGDGAAAAVLRVDGQSGWRIGAVGEHTWPDTLDIMGWRVDPAGLGVVLDANLPAFVQRRFAEASAAFLNGAGLEPSEVARFVCHPGGAKVLPALEASLNLAEGAFDHERAVLAEFGNVSAPTVFFVLERVLAERESANGGGRLVAAALGPGFTASFASLERADA
jgi:alkylresorcinol/alkylpyrone synthase